ncbi:MAG: hypothetical protein A3H97_20125 [Acidobacteria bacterium RIFCSPLOWO2_02_FULL_65_29]|nr:MAG: hypothetical protein A3H97_20125 [Acidobacteria bacterium RIFCSPLOWO2_02_FULL_65_29]
MREIEDDLRRERRARLLEKGAPEDYRDADIYAAVEAVLRRAVETRNHDAVLLPDVLGDEDEWKLQTRLRFSSHRPIVGPIVVFLKRRLLLPITRWLYEYSLENFQRQQRVNRILFACIEELAIENAKLRRIAERKD